MELVFEGKRKREDILSDIEKQGASAAFAYGRSYLYAGDNYGGMLGLLNRRKAFVDMVYIDPPFNTSRVYSVGEGRTSTVSAERNGKVAYSDFMKDDEFLAMMYERFVLIRELLSERGSLYVHIDVKMSGYFKILLDEIFGKECFKNEITRVKSNPKNFERRAYGNEKDAILFYAKNPNKNIWNDVRVAVEGNETEKKFPKTDADGRRYNTIPLHAPGESRGITGKPWRGMTPPAGRHWRTSPEEFEKLDAAGAIEWSATGNPRIKKYADEHRGKKIQDVWTFKDPQYPAYPTQKNAEMLKLMVEQSSEEGGYVMDCFAGGGTALLAAAQAGRKFIGMDKSPVAVELIEKRLLGADYVFEQE